jgi:neutral amino acid transport system permease protein
VNPSLGFGQLLLVLTAAILGGAGSPYGAVVGSYILGIGISLAIGFLPTGVSEFGTTMAFVVLIVVLLIRPGGIVNQEVRQS